MGDEHAYITIIYEETEFESVVDMVNQELNHVEPLRKAPTTPPLLIQRPSAVPPAPRVLKASGSVDKDHYYTSIY